ncbi:MAG: putative collagen-binding domain-containing protein [Planctomycetota bacterium]
MVYLPQGGEVSVDLSATPGTIAVEWINPSDGRSSSADTVQGGKTGRFAAPFSGDAVLLLTAK